MSSFVDVLKLVAIAAQMLDAGYQMPDIKDYLKSENEKHPVSLRGVGSTSRRPEASIQYQLMLARVLVAAT
jgi:hypothetical protein